jgi:5-(carboxyamino)imidazole ribonucleotide mutase
MTEMSEQPLVCIVMGSRSDLPIMNHAADALQALGIPHEVKVISAHRTPDLLIEYARNLEGRGVQVVIGGAGGAAHLPGMLAALSTLPVLGVPMPSKSLLGIDSLLSIVQMPKGVPVGTLGIGTAGAINAALLAAQILANQKEELKPLITAYKDQYKPVPLDPNE